MTMERTHAGQSPHRVGERVRVSGWVSVRRDHGNIIFIDLRDASGALQLVFRPDDADLHVQAEKLRPEWVIAAEGIIRERPKGMENPELATGSVELAVERLEVLAEAKTPPFPLDTDGYDIDEELRLKYRYLDLRRPRLQENLRLRSRVARLVREYLHREGFLEIETPMLTKTSPEGARDFLVPSRLHPGKFYALPQAPQQYKQLLMIAGVERYFQIARAIRDEDLRADRSFEHTQIDIEMAFAGEAEIFNVVEGLMAAVAGECGKRVLARPFPVFTHAEALAKFGADKFDLRPDPKDPDTLAFAWVTEFPLFERDAKTGRYTFAHNPFSAPKPEHVAHLLQGENLDELSARQYDLVCNGYEVASGGVRISDPEVQRRVLEIIGLTPEETEERFGHLLEAYRYGAPPHAGIAPGLDRLVMILAGEEHLREVQAFPMTSGGRTAVMDAPAEVDPGTLAELGIEIKERG